MNISQAKQIPLTELLAQLNHTPRKNNGREAWYSSPFSNDSIPSFKVNTVENVWYDFSTGQGGAIIEFVQAFYNCTVKEALKELDNITNGRYTPINREFEETKPLPKENSQKIIRKIKNLENEALLDYLASRKIPLNIAKHYLEEVYYTINGKNLFGIGFKNDSGGYEIRNKFFKGSLKGLPKDITTLKSTSPLPNPKKLLIFEGFLDFFSFFTCKKINYPHELKEDVIVLNTLSFVEKLIGDILPKSDYKEIELYLDNDESGEKAVNKFLIFCENQQIKDCSNFYSGFSDLNDYLINQ